MPSNISHSHHLYRECQLGKPVSFLINLYIDEQHTFISLDTLRVTGGKGEKERERERELVKIAASARFGVTT